MATTRSRRSTSSPAVDKPSELDAFARFGASTLTTEDGAPFVLHPFQRTILTDFFDGVREEVVLLPKKNGKSSLVAALHLWHLLSMPFAEAMIVAAARDQAGIIMRQVTGFIRRSPQLRARLKIVQREIRNPELDGRLRVLASDVDTIDGQLPTLVAVDELGRHRRAELYGVLRDGLGPRDGQLIAISTAGDDEGSPLGVLRASAYSRPGMVRDGAHRYVRAGSFAFHEWALDAEQDLHDLDLVKTANPLVPLEELRERHDSPTMQEWQWRRFACGVWAAGEFGAVQPVDWHACMADPLVLPDGAQGPYVGVDMGLKWDSTAIVPLWIQGGGWVAGREAVPHRPGAYYDVWVQADEPSRYWVQAATVLEPPRDGTALPIDAIFDVCADLADRWPGATFVVDPLAGGEQLAQRIEAELDGCQAVTHAQSNLAMCRASARLAEAIASRRLEHTGDPSLTRHVLAAGIRQINEGWRLSKQRGSSAVIDGAVALAMALSAAADNCAPTEKPKVPPGGHRVRGFV